MSQWVRLSLGVALLAALPVCLAHAAPPFNCSAAQEQAEIAVCDSADLGLLDREMNRLYFSKRDGLKAAGKQQDVDALRTEQRAFLKTRNECSYDTACLTALYKARLKALGQ